MSILRAMYAGVSGLGAEGQALGVVGDNVANTNTVGFKSGRAMFADVLGGAIGSGSAGGGVRMLGTQQMFTQGAILNTGLPTDMALSGDGFFTVQGTVDGMTGSFYTRAGQGKLRADGTLVNPEGLAFQGYAMKPDGTYSPAASGIQLPTAALPPKLTKTLTITANLDSSATTPALPWNKDNPSATSNFSTSMKVYDSLGKAHDVDVYYRKTAAGSWDWHAVTPGADVVGGTAGTNTEIATGTMTFTTTGALNTNTVTAGGTVSFVGATPGQPLTFDMGTPIAAGGTGLTGTTQFTAPSSVSSQNQDGYASGDLAGVKIEADGTVSGSYSNGVNVPVAKLAIAKFRANEGLGKAGHNLWISSQASGPAALGIAGSGGRGAIVAGALEGSNVDIAGQFVDLIAHQRSFQANSKTITTADQMLEEVVNLKR